LPIAARSDRVGPFDLIAAPLRSLLRAAEGAEAEAVQHSPLAATHELEARLGEAVTAAHRAAESVERHVEVIETLAQSLPPLTESVTRLTDQLNHVLRVTAPVAAVERDVSRLENLFRRRQRAGGLAGADPPAGSEPPSEPGAPAGP
jgi:ABC-type transporter Mla subunit MlaD